MIAAIGVAIGLVATAGAADREANQRSPTAEHACRLADYRVNLILSDATLTRDELDAMLRPHHARVATCQSQSGCWGRYGVPGYVPQPYESMAVLVQLPLLAKACARTARAIEDDPVFKPVLQEVWRVRLDANCTCDNVYSDILASNARVPGSPDLPPPKGTRKERRRLRRDLRDGAGPRP